MWHWASPDDVVVPWSRMVALGVDVEAKARAVAQYPSQTVGAEPTRGAHVLTRFARENELFVVEAPIIGEAYFDDMLVRRAAPWGLESRWYERRKRALACHWRHPLEDGELSGDRVHAALAQRALPLIVRHAEDDLLIDVYSPDDRSVATRTGLR